MKIPFAARAAASACLVSSVLALSMGTLSLSTGTLGLSMGAWAAENTAVTTPAGSTHGALANGNLPKAIAPDQLTDSGIPASSVTTATNAQTLQNKTISGAQNTLSAVPTAALATPQGNGGKVQLSTGTTTGGDVAEYDASGNVIDGNALLTSLAPLPGANIWTGLNSFNGGLALPTGSNPTGSNLYVDSSSVLHFVNGHDWTLIGSCFLADCTHPYILVPFTAGATYTTTGGKSPLGCLRQEFYNGGASGDNFCINSIYDLGDGVTITTTAPFTAGTTNLTVTANNNIGTGQSVSGFGIAPGTTVSSYSAGNLQISHGLTVGVMTGSSISVLIGSSGVAPANNGTAIQATLSQYTTQAAGQADSTAARGFASKYFPSQTITTGGNWNSQDFTGRESSVAGATLGGEIDVGASGPDDAQSRFGLDVIGYESGQSGDGATHINSLLRLRSPSAEAHLTPNPTIIDNGIYCATMPGGSARGVYGSFQHCSLADGGETIGVYDAISGTLTANPSANASSGQPNIVFPLTTNIDVGQIVSGSANIPTGTTVIATYQCNAANALSGCGSVTNAELVVLSADLTGAVGTSTPLTFTGVFNDGSQFSGYFNDAFANWTSLGSTGKIKAGTSLNSGNILDICGQGEDSLSLEACYGDILFGISSNTHGSVVGSISLVPAGGGSVILPVTGSTQCLHVNLSGVVSGTGSDCGSGSGSGNALFGTITGNVADDIVTMSNATTGIKDSGTAISSLATLASPSFIGTVGLPDSMSVGSSGLSGGSINSTSVGQSTPAAGAFTTLLASNDLTTDRHVLSNGPALSCSSLAFGSGAGSSPTCNSVTGDDHKLNINFTSGTSPATSSPIAAVTFANAYPAGPQCQLSANNGNAGTSIAKMYLSSTTATVVLNATSAGIGASTLFIVNINC